MSRYSIGGFAKFNTAFICQAYLLIGYLIRVNEGKLSSNNIAWSFELLIVYILLCFLSPYIFDNLDFDSNLNQYYNIPYCYLLIITGCVSLFFLAKKCLRMPRWLVYIGQNTFVLYLWAGHAMLLFVALSKNGVNLPQNSLIITLVYTTWAIAFCMLSAYFINNSSFAS